MLQLLLVIQNYDETLYLTSNLITKHCINLLINIFLYLNSNIYNMIRSSLKKFLHEYR